MPESVQDRPSSALEYFFLLVKDQKYYYDIDAIRVPSRENNKSVGANETSGYEHVGRNRRNGVIRIGLWIV